MTDDPSERIRDLQVRISQWERVHDHEIQQERNVQQKLKETLSLSFRVTALGSIPSVIWLLSRFAVTTENEVSLAYLMGLSTALVIFGIITYGAARASGLAAHWWFCRSAFGERSTTIAIALAADALLFWWMTYLLE